MLTGSIGPRPARNREGQCQIAIVTIIIVFGVSILLVAPCWNVLFERRARLERPCFHEIDAVF